MAEYINKTRLMQRIHTGMTLIEAMQEIIEAPAADVVERRVGHWMFHPEQKNIYGGKLIECSECRTQYLVRNVVEEIYCRHCGSKNQDGGQKE